VSSTNGAQPCALAASPVSSQTLVLTQPATWQKEADAYAAAIREYFGRGVPRFGEARWEPASGSDGTVQVAAAATATVMTTERFVLPVDPDGSRIDTIRVLVDGETVYAPRDGNDRLLLGLKGSLNKDELDLLGQRSLSARYAKARRGELVVAAPVGCVKSGERQEEDGDREVHAAKRRGGRNGRAGLWGEFWIKDFVLVGRG